MALLGAEGGARHAKDEALLGLLTPERAMPAADRARVQTAGAIAP